MRILLSCLVLLTFSVTAFTQQPTTPYQDNRISIPGRTVALPDREITLPYEVSPCADVDPTFFFRVEDVFSVTGIGTIAQGDVLEGKATVPTDIVIVEVAKFWNVMLSFPKGLQRYNALRSLRDSPTFSKKTTLTSIQGFRQQLPAATKGMEAVGISLRGIPVANVGRRHYVFGVDFPERFGYCSCVPENSSSSARRPRQD